MRRAAYVGELVESLCRRINVEVALTKVSVRRKSS